MTSQGTGGASGSVLIAVACLAGRGLTGLLAVVRMAPGIVWTQCTKVGCYWRRVGCTPRGQGARAVGTTPGQWIPTRVERTGSEECLGWGEHLLMSAPSS